MKDHEFITSYGIFSTIVVTVVGVGIFAYPRELANYVGTDGWIVTLVVGLISYLLLLLIWKVIKGNNYNEFTILVKDNFGKGIGGFLMLIFAGGNILAISSALRTFVEVVKMHLLEKTPTEFILVITILTSVYLVRGGLSSIVRFNEVALWIMFVPMFFVLLFVLGLADFTNIFPVLRNPPENYFKVLRYSVFSFGGMEVAFLVFPHMKEKKNSKKMIFRGIAFITVFYTIITILTLAIFSSSQVRTLLWPTMTMIRSIDIAGTFIERWEGVVMALWIIYFFTTFANIFYFSSNIVKEVFSLGDVKISSLIIVPFIYILAMFTDNVAEVYHINVNILPYIILFNVIILPLILLFNLNMKSRSKGGKV
jgi:spore germination protein